MCSFSTETVESAGKTLLKFKFKEKLARITFLKKPTKKIYVADPFTYLEYLSNIYENRSIWIDRTDGSLERVGTYRV